MGHTHDSPPADLLIIDDDEGLLILMGETLRNAGYAIRSAPNVTEAVRQIEAKTPRLLLLDLKLRASSGPALIDRLMKDNRPLPFVVITGQGDEKVAVEMMRKGALDYVRKDTGLLDLLPNVVARSLAALDRERALDEEKAERSRLEREVLEIGERERTRIGAELHDGLGQQLTALEILSAGLKSDLKGQPTLAAQVERIAGGLRDAVSQVRALSRGLVPVRDEPDALWAGLIGLAEQTSSLGQVTCVFESEKQILVPDHAAASHLYRIAQEAVNNALKHARARRITLALEEHDGEIELRIADDGRGFAAGAKRGGIGLQLMRHRAEVIGARLSVDPGPGSGTIVRCRLPMSS